jgi:hypothetical protein
MAPLCHTRFNQTLAVLQNKTFTFHHLIGLAAPGTITLMLPRVATSASSQRAASMLSSSRTPLG